MINISNFWRVELELSVGGMNGYIYFSFHAFNNFFQLFYSVHAIFVKFKRKLNLKYNVGCCQYWKRMR